MCRTMLKAKMYNQNNDQRKLEHSSRIYLNRSRIDYMQFGLSYFLCVLCFVLFLADKTKDLDNCEHETIDSSHVYSTQLGTNNGVIYQLSVSSIRNQNR